MDYCEGCSGVTVESLAAGFHHPDPLWQIQASVDRCRMCNLISRSISSGRGIRDASYCRYVYLDRYGDVRNGGPRLVRSLGNTFVNDNEMGRFHIGVEMESNGKEEVEARGVNGITDQIPSSSAESEECFQFLQRKLHRCVNWHRSCNERRNGFLEDTGVEPFLPTRAIDVGSAGGPVKIFVQPPNPEDRRRAKYTTLSHCWGPKEKRPITTTSKNLVQHQEAVQFQSLPKTFQDAVTITRRLGVQYLWIDSLCILQDEDDLSDWEREAKTMGSVYQHSYLTIAATGASDSSQGCFIPRVTLDLTEIPLFSRRGEGPRVFLYTDAEVPQVPDDIGPLAHRAWITQEWALSPRVIHYCSTKLIWMCDYNRETECGSENDASFLLVANGISDQIWGNMSWAETMFDEWHQIVGKYSSRGLTKTTDKLIALQGLINKLEEVSGEKCIFGLWYHRLPEDLLWETSGNQPVLESAEDLRELGIPSWSWASKVGEVCWWEHWRDETESIAKILELPKPGGKELRVQSSCMRIPRLRVCHPPDGSMGRFDALEETGEEIGVIQFDFEGPTVLGGSENPEYYIIPLVVLLNGRTPESISGLVLSRVAGIPGLFQREGVIGYIALGYFDGRGQEMICII